MNFQDLQQENKLFKKENELLKKENELFRKQIKRYNLENQTYCETIKQITTKMHEIIKNSKSKKLNLNIIDECLTVLENKTINNLKSDTKIKSIQNKNINTYEKVNKKSSSFHNNDCNCYSCEIAELSNRLYYHCIDFVDKKITDSEFNEKILEDINKCNYIKKFIMRKNLEIIKQYRLDYNLLKLRYNKLKRNNN